MVCSGWKRCERGKGRLPIFFGYSDVFFVGYFLSLFFVKGRGVGCVVIQGVLVAFRNRISGNAKKWSRGKRREETG